MLYANPRETPSIAAATTRASANMIGSIACILVDWGTTNLRAWAVDAEGRILAQRLSPKGLLTVGPGEFATILGETCADWLEDRTAIPILMCGMIGSKLGWREVPYLSAPVSFDELGRHLVAIQTPFAGPVAIVPGIMMEDDAQPEVMRGEESQIIGALHALGVDDGAFLLPGTHSKWALVENRKLVSFRTYMTGELYGLLRHSGTLAQLMDGEAFDDAAFRSGVLRAQSPEAGVISHALFAVRTLGLLDRVPKNCLASYLSGLLIGAEFCDGAAWLATKGKSGLAAGIGTPAMLASYRLAGSLSGLSFTTLDSAAILPAALLSIAVSAGLIAATGKG